MSTGLSKNLFNFIFKYIGCQDITNFSLTSKYFYSLLNPENNPHINTFYRDLAFEFFFNINNEKNYKKIKEDYLLDDFNKTKNNWKKIFQNLKSNSEKCMKKEISEEIYKCFRTHLYMPYQRKQNNILEYENSTLHQIICYDMNKNDYINKKYYDTFFNIKNENNKIVPLRKGLFFEEELINFKSEINNYYNKKIMKMITSYSFKKLNNVYFSIINQKKDIKINDNKKKKYKMNYIYIFVVWLNHTFILFIDLIFNYVYQFINIKDPIKLIIEYTKMHSNLINFGLKINENFNNINIILNLLIKENTSKSTNNGFKIYNMFLNIMEKNFYQKLKPLLNKNIEKIINLMSNEYFEIEKMNNSFNCHSIETNNTEQKNGENNNIDEDDSYDFLLNESICEDVDLEDDDKDLNNDDGFTYKNVIEDYSNSILDYCINKENSIFINSSKIKLNEIYNEYEKLMMENVMESIKIKLKENKEINLNNNALINEGYDSLCSAFSFVKAFFGKEEKGGFKLINRTKLNIFIYCINYLFKYLKKIINNKETNFINEDNDFAFNNGSDEQNIIYELYLNELNNNKIHLLNNNEGIKDNKIEQNVEQLIINYLNLNDENELKKLLKEILLFFYNQVNLFKAEDKKIYDNSLKIKN